MIGIIFAGFMVADAIMFVNGYRGYLFGTKTDQKKRVRANWFVARGIEWDGKQ